MSAAAARQRLSRLPEDVRILRGLRFARGSRFIYLDHQFGTEEYWDALIRAIDTANPAYAAALNGLRSRGGIIPSDHFDIISGSPLRQSRQLPSSAVLQGLISVGLVKRQVLAGVGEFIYLAGKDVTDVSGVSKNLHPRLVTEKVLLEAMRTWVGRMNLASPKVTTIRDDTPAPQFATFRFDLSGPSYVRPLVRIRKGKALPGFLVADVVVGRELTEGHISPFLRKCTLLSHLRKIRPFLPILAADSFTPAALRACRGRGIMAITPDTLFGRDVARGLAELLETMSNAAAIAAAAPERLEDLFGRLGKIEGAAGNLRGALFELVVGHMVRSIEGGSIDIGVLVRNPEDQRYAEIDVRHVKEREVSLYECRGHQPTTRVRLAAVQTWLEQKVPTIYGALRQAGRFEDSRFRFEYWSCGTFDDDALATLADAKRRTRRYSIDWKDRTAIETYAGKLQAPGVRKILNEHYFDHPLNRLEDAAVR